MYKTVRLGENSLQYTILPQTEEALGGNGMKGKGYDHIPIQVEQDDRGKPMNFLVVICSVVLAVAALLVGSAVLLTMYAAEPRVQITTTAERAINLVGSAALVSTHSNDVPKSRKKELRMPEVTTPDIETTSVETTVVPTLSTTVGDKKTKPAWSMPAFKLFRKTSTSTPKGTTQMPVVEDEAELDLPNGPFRRHKYSQPQWDVIIRPTLSPKPAVSTTSTTQMNTFTKTEVTERVPQTSNTARTTPEPTFTTQEDVLITTKWNMIPLKPIPTEENENDDSDDKNYPLGKDLTGLKDRILDIEDDQGFKELEVEDDTLKMPMEHDRKAEEEYFNRRYLQQVSKTAVQMPKIWPFGPSKNLFQWADDEDDRAILPLLLSTATLVLMALIITVVVVRRRKDLARGANALGNLTADLQPDDNTNLLTKGENQE